MPIYEYIHEDEQCENGENKFEILQSIKDDELTICPKCGKPVKRIISVPGKAGGPEDPDATLALARSQLCPSLLAILPGEY